MESRSIETGVMRFATFEVDLRSRELRKGGMKLKLGGQPFQVLAILLEQPGAIVTRDELQKRLWPDTFVDVDHNLNAAINKIRDVLGDSAENPRFVETLPRRGYRLLVPSERLGISKVRHETLPGKASWIPVGMTLLLFLGVGIWHSSHKGAEPTQSFGEVMPLSGLPGFQAYPAFSPDGKQVAFVIEDQNQNPSQT